MHQKTIVEYFICHFDGQRRALRIINISNRLFKGSLTTAELVVD